MDNIKYVLDNVSRDDTADYMFELLTDSDNPTYKMFEEMASSYLDGNEEFRKGFNRACSILTGWNIETIGENLKKKHEEYETEWEDDEDDDDWEDWEDEYDE